jgi:tetratricopeptide (TPR) repeat protein
VRWDEYTVEKYYDRIEKHLRDLGVWEETISKFPPQAIRSAIEKILSRLDEYDMDYELLDWPILFEGLRDFDSVEAFIKHLEATNEIPKPKTEYTQELLAQYERELHELGYRIVREESYLKYLTSKERTDEINRLKRKIAEYQRKIAELEKALEIYEKTKTIPPANIPPPAIKTTKTTIMLSQTISLDQFFNAIKRRLSLYYLPPEYIDMLLQQYRNYFITAYNEMTQEQFMSFLDNLFNWLITDVMKTPEYKVYSAQTLAQLGVSIRTPAKEKRKFMGKEIETYPSMERLESKFLIWTDSLKKAGWSIEYGLISIEAGATNIIHTSVGTPNFLVYINLLIGADTPIIAYNYYPRTNSVRIYFYDSIAYVINALTLK